MKSIKLSTIIRYCLLLNLLPLYGYAQVNIIPNSGFENGGMPLCDYNYNYDDPDPSDYPINDWKPTGDATGNDVYDSFDWFDKTFFLNKVCTGGIYDNTLPPFLSDHFIGFYGHEQVTVEGARVTLTKKLESGKTYILRLKAAFSESHAPLPSSDPRVRVHLTKHGENWENFADPFNTHIRDLVQFHINKNKPYEWQFFYKAFTIPSDKNNEMQNFVIEADKDNPNCYIYVDDVELYEVDPCNLSCRPAMGTVGLTPNGQNAGYIWNGGNSDFCLEIDNALGFEITIGSTWGTLYTNTSYDIMGLQNTATPGRFQFCWDGKTNGGARFMQGGFPFLIKIWNCNSVIEFDQSITILNNTTSNAGNTASVNNIDPTCLQLPNWQDYTQHITGDETWNSNMAINGNVIVEPDATLTVEDNLLVMRPGTKIIVKKGGRLFLNGATLTSTIPGQPWGGVEIEGDPTASQASIESQGYANIFNSTLQHSKNTVTVHGGGILQCRSSQFLNNDGGNISFERYLSPVNAVNKSRIISNYFDGGNASYIGLYMVKKVLIDHNEFNVEDPDAQFPAISSREASYVITNNTFNNMPTGITDICVTGMLNGSTIAYNKFNNGSIGAYIIGGAFMDINTNVFYDTRNYSLIVKNAQGFKITENTFASAVQQTKPVGVRIENSSPYGGELYKNTFTGYNVSSMTQYSNMALSIDCNTYNEYNNAIGVLSGNLKDQGLCWNTDPVTPVVNFFGNGCTFTSSQIAVNNNVPSFAYRTFNNTVPTNVTPNKVNIEVCAPMVSEQSCPFIHNISCNGDIPCQENILNRINESTDPDEIRFLKNELLRDYINNDTVDTEPSKAKAYLNELTEDATASKMLISESVYTGDYTDARQRIENLAENTEDDLAFKELYTILTDAFEENFTLEQTYEMYQSQINEVAVMEGFAGSQAKDIISYINGTVFNIPVFELDPEVMSDCFEQQINLRTKANPSDENIALGNATPNPFSNQSEVACFIPRCLSAELVITDMVGREVRVYQVSQGHNTVTVKANGLAEGIYFYSLKVDGNIVETKKLVISK